MPAYVIWTLLKTWQEAYTRQNFSWVKFVPCCVSSENGTLAECFFKRRLSWNIGLEPFWASFLYCIACKNSGRSQQRVTLYLWPFAQQVNDSNCTVIKQQAVNKNLEIFFSYSYYKIYIQHLIQVFQINFLTNLEMSLSQQMLPLDIFCLPENAGLLMLFELQKFQS